jgi:hypothetical protein
MRHARSLIVACSLAIAASAVPAAPGDVVVPAHRTKDGQWVPANVPPTSGKTTLARRPTRVAAATKRQAATPQGASPTQEGAPLHAAPLLPPLLVEAQPIRH